MEASEKTGELLESLDRDETLLIVCPSCGHNFVNPPRIEEITRGEWVGGPELVCPACNGHSDRSACIEAGLAAITKFSDDECQALLENEG